MVNKRYKDLFAQYVHKGERTPLTIGVVVVFGLCFLILVVATFTQIKFSHPWFEKTDIGALEYTLKTILYNPQTPAMVFCMYILGSAWCTLLFILYTLVGLFVCPIFAFGGGLGYVQSYFFGYFLGFLFAIFAFRIFIKKGISLKYRLLASLSAVVAIHLTGSLYCVILAIFRMIDFSMVIPIVSVLSFSKILYDIVFSMIVVLFVPYIKNILWIAMKPVYKTKKSENTGIRHKVIGDNIY